ncbi:MAG: hypothetical protein H7Y89_18490 [Steroidobacteraceae bacterium]|nr:hypothetical protein [Steroidobacteraceae bacterium]
MTTVPTRRTAASFLLCALAAPLLAAEPAPCTCPDMLDLTNRNRQVKTAIAGYERSLAGWQTAGGAPAATETSRKQFQDDSIEPAMIEMRDSRANGASANTGGDCNTTVNAPTACLTVLMNQHEQVHQAACRAHREAGTLLSDLATERWQTLADYAREEIEGYKAERTYIEAALTNLERDCRYTLEFKSTIVGSTEITKSEANTSVDLAIYFPRGIEPLGLNGSKPLSYDTRDVGPPKVVGNALLKQLHTNCYVASVGSGNVPFEVREAWMMRETQPPYGPLLVMPIYVGETQETRYLKGPRKCPRKAEPVPFWSHLWTLSKEAAAPVEADPRSGSPASGAGVLVTEWNFLDASGDEAEKAIRVPCPGWGGMQEMAAAYAGLPTAAPTCEFTDLKLTRKK